MLPFFNGINKTKTEAKPKNELSTLRSDLKKAEAELKVIGSLKQRLDVIKFSLLNMMLLPADLCATVISYISEDIHLQMKVLQCDIKRCQDILNSSPSWGIIQMIVGGPFGPRYHNPSLSPVTQNIAVTPRDEEMKDANTDTLKDTNNKLIK